ncbi:MAG: A/G-specific adenine glycosylase [Aestuariivita sp.]|nr:A/G-specific adenine glycosylase [Aestuariivita sp.]MCY4346412.1 A/G-specific adenine glycosylase [Aestuariivita sp.]
MPTPTVVIGGGSSLRDQEAYGKSLLNWYDENARVLPWRISPHDRIAGRVPDPYRVWLSEIMLQQTTVATVDPYFRRFVSIWPTISDLAAAEESQVMGEWAGLGYYARARNLIRCARIINVEYGGVFPQSKSTLIQLPGIGSYTAAAIAAIAFDHQEAAVDGNVARIIVRLFDIDIPVAKSKTLIQDLANELVPMTRAGDYAQAAMDLGALICTARKPKCVMCPLQNRCKAYSAGTAADLPRKPPRKPKAERVGFAYVGRRQDGAWLIETRNRDNLLGGMLGWPGTSWTETAPIDDEPCAAEWEELLNAVLHSFTHFNLSVIVKVAELPADCSPERGFFLPASQFDPLRLPTLMQKIFTVASQHLGKSR